MSVSERSLRTGVEPPVDAAGDGHVDGASRSEADDGAGPRQRNLAWKLCAPAVVVMLLVTAYPMVYSVWLSLQKYDLRFPDEREFVGLANYGDVLTSSLWWDDLFTTLLITGITVVVELVLGLGLALSDVPGHLRTANRARVHPHPLRHRHRGGGVGLALRLRHDHRLRQRASSITDGTQRLARPTGEQLVFVIILTEVWKTTPFMALLLLAGLALVPRAARGGQGGRRHRVCSASSAITLPLMKPAILVACCSAPWTPSGSSTRLRHPTEGANGTETVSILGYNQLVNR